MKSILFSFVFLCFVSFAQNIYFSNPLSTTTFYSFADGTIAINYSMYAANGIYVYSWYARLTYPDNSQSNWMEGRTGGWYVTKAGIYKIEGKAYVDDIFQGEYWAHRDPFSFHCVDNQPTPQPQNPSVAQNASNHPQLNWSAVSAADFDHYNVYKYVYAEQGWLFLSSTTSTTYEDATEHYATFGPTHDVQYKITAVDINSNESVASSTVTATVAGAKLDKKGNTLLITPKAYFLGQNFPNPFNPSTKINYQISQKGLVQLKVYDLTGREVASLVNQIQDAGEYTATFDAKNLSTGVYLYSIRVNDFIFFQKMSLVK